MTSSAAFHLHHFHSLLVTLFITTPALCAANLQIFGAKNPSDLLSFLTNRYVSRDRNPPAGSLFTAFRTFSSLSTSFPHPVLLVLSGCPRTYIYLVTICKQPWVILHLSSSPACSHFLSTSIPPTPLPCLKGTENVPPQLGAVDIFYFFFPNTGPREKRGQLCGEKCSAKIKPIRCCTPSENTEPCHTFLSGFHLFIYWVGVWTSPGETWLLSRCVTVNLTHRQDD